MVLTVEQIRERIKNPDTGLRAELAKAYRHDKRCAMHTDPEEKDTHIRYLADFLAWVGKILNGDKFEVFKHLLVLPVKTVEITNGILDELKKVFEAQDRFYRVNFTSPELVNDSAEYKKKIGLSDYFKTDGFQVMKSEINSFIIVDLPPLEQQRGNLPEPYFYRIDADDVLDVRLTLSQDLEYIIFKEDGFIYAFDDLTYRKFAADDPWTLIAEAPHGLGYCPANTFWKTRYNSDSYIQKQGPISKSLSQLDWLLMNITSKDHLGLYAGFPVMIGFEQKCTYQDELTGATCENGWIDFMDAHNNPQRQACPKCQTAKKILGPGTFLTAPAPATKDDPNLMDGFKFVGAETESLTWMQGDVDSQIAWLTYNIIGVPDEVTSMAINEKQVVSQFESRINVLIETKNNFERIDKWLNDTIDRLRYGAAFQGSTLKYGERFFLYSADQLKKSYEESKSKGAAMYELASQRHQIIEAQAKNNPELKQRLYLLSWLEPYPDMAVSDLSGIGVSGELVNLKAGFDNYISRFEMEFTDIVSFMAAMPLAVKVEFIRQKMLEYVRNDLGMQEGS